MALRKPEKELKNFEYKHLKNKFDNSNLKSPTHLIDMPTNLEIKSITLEDIDKAVFMEFNKRFVIKDKQMPLISMDTEEDYIQYMNYEQYDRDKQFLNAPFFVYTRTANRPKYRSNPSNKKAIYTIPQSKPQGIVFVDYIAEQPIMQEFFYTFKFMTNYREHVNQMEGQMFEYFRNKRNIIYVQGERFSIGPQDQNQISELEIANMDSMEERTFYIITYNLKVYGWTRSGKVQKRERPNNFTIDIVVKNDKGLEIEKDSSSFTIDKFEMDTNDYPEHP